MSDTIRWCKTHNRRARPDDDMCIAGVHYGGDCVITTLVSLDTIDYEAAAEVLGIESVSLVEEAILAALSVEGGDAG